MSRLVLVPLLGLVLAGCGGGESIESRAQSAVREQTGNVHLRVSDCVATGRGRPALTDEPRTNRWDCILSDPVTGSRRTVSVGRDWAVYDHPDIRVFS